MKKRIYKAEFNEILKYTEGISQQEREYLNKAFAGDLLDGLTEWELTQKIQKLKFDTEDPIDQWDSERVKQKILKAMEK
jgi:hypothetical protein